MSSPEPPGKEDVRAESETTRDDRNLAELLQELRVAGLGVQVLFGFLLALPFSSRFTRLTGAQRDLYVADLVLAAIATALLVGPVAYHRLVFRRHLKEYLVRTANVMAICGLITVALAISVAVLLIVSFVVPGMPAIVISTCVFCLFGALWLLLPIARRAQSAGALSAPGAFVTRVRDDRGDRRDQPHHDGYHHRSCHGEEPDHRPGQDHGDHASAH